TVNLTAASAPAGVTTTCVPSSISGSQTSTCTLSATNAGSYTVTISGTSGSLVHTATVAATVIPPDFSLSANPASVSFGTGQSVSSTISLSSTGGFAGTVNLTAVSVPTTCSPAILVGTQSSVCTVNSTTISTYTVTITGTSGNLSHTASIDVRVTPVPPPDFALDANPPALSFAAGDSGSTTISLQST